MLVDVKVPVLAESVAEATLMNWYKKTGESVKRGDSLIEIETDKVTLEVAAISSGTLIEILKGDGEAVTSDEIIAKIDTAANPSKAAGMEGTAAVAAAIPQQQSLLVGDPADVVPKLSPAVRNLLEQHNLDVAAIPASGDHGRLTKEDILGYLESRSIPRAPVSEPVQAEPVPEPEPPAETESESVPEPVPEPEPPAETESESVPESMPKADLETVAGSIPETNPEKLLAIPTTVNKPGPDISAGRPEERVAMTRLRRRAAERLLSAQHENAILTTFNEINMQPVMDLRSRYRNDFESAHGVKLGFMSFFTKAVVEALKKFPIINASTDAADIIYHGYFDIGIAISSPRGLVVPIVRDADLLSFAEIEIQIKELGEKARDSKLTIEELTGGTFTITNGGIFGSLLSTPIINPPQSAILGMHSIQDRPVAENGAVVIRPVMYVALSYDHRIIDGRDAVQFLVTVKQQLEDPARLLLQI